MKKQFSIWMDEEDLEKLDEICRQVGDLRSAYCRRAVLKEMRKLKCDECGAVNETVIRERTLNKNLCDYCAKDYEG